MHLSVFPKILNKQRLHLKALSFPLQTVLCNMQYAAYFQTVWNPLFVFQTLFTRKPAQDRLKITFYF